MSAFVVDKIHIDVLVSAGLRFSRPDMPMRWYLDDDACSHALTDETATKVGQMLWRENLRSVNYRYQENEPETLYRFVPLPGRPDPVKVLKALSCFEYQACETPDWRQSE